MKVTYTVPVRGGVVVPMPDGTANIVVGPGRVSWVITPERHLEAIVIELRGAEIRYNENGAILPTYPELENEAYRIANYVCDSMFQQISRDTIQVDHVLSEAPAIASENAQEEQEFNQRAKVIWKDLPLVWETHRGLDVADYGRGYGHSVAVGYYADAMRTPNDFQRLELLYKVVEYFFAEDGPQLDAAVSTHVLRFNGAFTQDAIEQLRLLRNRSVHPRARRGHVNPRNIADAREVRNGLPQMQALAELLLERPTF